MYGGLSFLLAFHAKDAREHHGDDVADKEVDGKEDDVGAYSEGIGEEHDYGKQEAQHFGKEIEPRNAFAAFRPPQIAQRVLLEEHRGEEHGRQHAYGQCLLQGCSSHNPRFAEEEERTCEEQRQGSDARVLDQRTKGVEKKYVNSPDSDIYHKERELYGLYQAKKAIAKENCVYMVEGYTDVISMHQCGIENVVANSGTALSVHQIRLLHRFTNNIVLLYDGDAAGVHAALRGTDMLLEEEMNVKVLLLPDGNDPDSFARSHTASDFRKYIEENQTDFIQFKTHLMLKGVTDPVKRSEAINSIVESISKIKNQITRASYITDCSHRLGVSEAIIVNALNNFVRNGLSEQVKEERRAAGLRDQVVQQAAQTGQQMGGTTPEAKLREVEDLIIQIVIHHGEELITVKDSEQQDVELPVAQYIMLDMQGDGFEFHNPIYNKVLHEAVEHIGDEDFKAETYFANHPDPAVSRLAGMMTGEQEVSTASLQLKLNPEKLRQMVFKDMLSFRTHYIAQRLVEVRQQFVQNPNNMELIAEFTKLKQMNSLLAAQANFIFN